MLEKHNCLSYSVSVIIPVFNASNSIGLCLDALQQQTYSENCYEIIVVDDGSTDDSANIIAEHRVHYCYQNNSGPAKARNKGASEASGEILLFTDSDCVPDSNWIEEMVKSFDDKRVMAVKGIYRSENNSLVARFVQIEFEERYKILAEYDSIDMVDTYSAAYRNEIFKSLGGFDSRFPAANNEDTELSYRMVAKKYKMMLNQDAIVCHLGHPETIVKYFSLKVSRGYWRMAVYRDFPEKIIKDTYTPLNLKLQLISLFVFILSLLATIFIESFSHEYLLLCGLLYLLTTISFSLFSWKKDRLVSFAAPLLLAIRAMALGIGIIFGIMYAKIK